MPKWNIENYASGNKQNLTPAHELVTKQPDSYTVTSGKKTYTLTRDEYKGVRDLYKTQWADNYGQDDEDQLNKRNGVMPRSFANSYKKGDQSLYDLGLPNSKYFEKYLEAYRTYKAENQKLIDSYKAKNKRLNEFYGAVSTQWFDDEVKNGSYDPTKILEGDTNTWDQRRQQQFFDLLDQPEWADVKEMYDLTRRKTKVKDPSAYKSIQEYYEAKFDADAKNRAAYAKTDAADAKALATGTKGTEKQLATALGEDIVESERASQYSVGFNFDDFDRVYGENIYRHLLTQGLVDSATGEVAKGRTAGDQIADIDKANKLKEAINTPERYVQTYTGGDYATMMSDLVNAGIPKKSLKAVRDEAVSRIENSPVLTDEEKKAQVKAVKDIEAAPRKEVASKVTSWLAGQMQNAINGIVITKGINWLEKNLPEKKANAEAAKEFLGAYKISKPEDYIAALRDMKANKRSDGEIREAYKIALRNTTSRDREELAIAYNQIDTDAYNVAQRIKLNYYRNNVGAIFGKSDDPQANTVGKADGSSMDVDKATELLNRSLSARGRASEEGIDSDLGQTLELLHRGGVSAPVLREAANRVVSAWSRSGQIPSDKIEDTIAAIEDSVNAYETSEHKEIFETAREELDALGYSPLDIHQAFSKMGWRDALDDEEWARAYYTEYQIPQEMLNSEDAEEWSAMSEDDRIAAASGIWDSLDETRRAELTRNFINDLEYNPVVNKDYGTQITEQWVGAWGKTAVGLITSGLNIAQLISTAFGNDPRKLAAAVATGQTLEGWDAFNASVATMNDVQAKLSMYGKAVDQDFLSDAISTGADVFAEIARMQTMNFIGGGIANGIFKVAGVDFFTTAAGSTAPVMTNIGKGWNMLAQMAASAPFISDATANYWAEAIQQEGATVKEALAYSLICGFLEGAVEKANADRIFKNALGGDELADKILNSAKNGLSLGDFQTKVKIFNMVSNALGEGAEEAFSYIASLVMGNLTFNKDEQDWRGVLTGYDRSQLWKEAGMGALVGLFANMAALSTYTVDDYMADYFERHKITANDTEVGYAATVVSNMSDADLNSLSVSTQDLLNFSELKANYANLLQIRASLETHSNEVDMKIQDAAKRKSELAQSIRSQQEEMDKTSDPKKKQEISAKIFGETGDGGLLAEFREASAAYEKATGIETDELIHNRNTQAIAAEKVSEAIRKHYVALYYLTRDQVTAMSTIGKADKDTIENGPKRAEAEENINSMMGAKILNPDALDEYIRQVGVTSDVLESAKKLSDEATDVLKKLGMIMDSVRDGSAKTDGEANAKVQKAPAKDLKNARKAKKGEAADTASKSSDKEKPKTKSGKKTKTKKNQNKQDEPSTKAEPKAQPQPTTKVATEIETINPEQAPQEEQAATDVQETMYDSNGIPIPEAPPEEAFEPYDVHDESFFLLNDMMTRLSMLTLDPGSVEDVRKRLNKGAVKLSEDTMRDVRRIAKKLGREVIFKDLKSGVGGLWDGNFIYINPYQIAKSDGKEVTADEITRRVLAHEFQHSIRSMSAVRLGNGVEVNSPEWVRFSNMILDLDAKYYSKKLKQLGDESDITPEARIDMKRFDYFVKSGGKFDENDNPILTDTEEHKQFYRDKGLDYPVQLTQAQAIDEVVSEFVQENMFMNESFINMFVREESGLAGKALNLIQYAINKLGVKPGSDQSFLLDAQRMYCKAFAKSNESPTFYYRRFQSYAMTDSEFRRSPEALGIYKNYVKAIQNKDMQECQRIVDDYANRMFKESKAPRDENGRLLRLYHGTRSSGHTVFNDGIPVFMSLDKKVAMSYSDKRSQNALSEKNMGMGGIYTLYADVRSPFVIDCDNSSWEFIIPKGTQYKSDDLRIIQVGVDSTPGFEEYIIKPGGGDEFIEYDSAEELESALASVYGDALATQMVEFARKYTDVNNGLPVGVPLLADRENGGYRLIERSMDEMPIGVSTDDYVAWAMAQRNPDGTPKYDSVLFENVVDADTREEGGGLATNLVVFDPKNLSSADPYTWYWGRDGKKKIVPVIDRFNTAINNVLYNLDNDFEMPKNVTAAMSEYRDRLRELDAEISSLAEPPEELLGERNRIQDTINTLRALDKAMSDQSFSNSLDRMFETKNNVPRHIMDFGDGDGTITADAINSAYANADDNGKRMILSAIAEDSLRASVARDRDTGKLIVWSVPKDGSRWMTRSTGEGDRAFLDLRNPLIVNGDSGDDNSIAVPNFPIDVSSRIDGDGMIVITISDPYGGEPETKRFESWADCTEWARATFGDETALIAGVFENPDVDTTLYEFTSLNDTVLYKNRPYLSSDALEQFAKDGGYDGIIRNIAETGDSLAIPFNQEQVKSIDVGESDVLATARFPQNDGVMYSFDGDASDASVRLDKLIAGKTAAQIDAMYLGANADKRQLIINALANRAMRDTQYRDKSGNVFTMYHGTMSPGFTEFDPDQVDDLLSFFFTPDLTWATYVEGDNLVKKARKIALANLRQKGVTESFIKKYSEKQAYVNVTDCAMRVLRQRLNGSLVANSEELMTANHPARSYTTGREYVFGSSDYADYEENVFETVILEEIANIYGEKAAEEYAANGGRLEFDFSGIMDDGLFAVSLVGGSLDGEVFTFEDMLSENPEAAFDFMSEVADIVNDGFYNIYSDEAEEEDDGTIEVDMGAAGFYFESIGLDKLYERLNELSEEDAFNVLESSSNIGVLKRLTKGYDVDRYESDRDYLEKYFKKYSLVESTEPKLDDVVNAAQKGLAKYDPNSKPTAYQSSVYKVALMGKNILKIDAQGDAWNELSPDYILGMYGDGLPDGVSKVGQVGINLLGVKNRHGKFSDFENITLTASDDESHEVRRLFSVEETLDKLGEDAKKYKTAANGRMGYKDFIRLVRDYYSEGFAHRLAYTMANNRGETSLNFLEGDDGEFYILSYGHVRDFDWLSNEDEDADDLPFKKPRIDLTTRDVAMFAYDKGYDGYLIENIEDFGGAMYYGDELEKLISKEQGHVGTIAVVFDPHNIKSLDAETYDNNGKLILPSARFDLNNPDIRYSLDSDMENYLGLNPEQTRERAQRFGEALDRSNFVSDFSRMFSLSSDWAAAGQKYRTIPQGMQPRVRQANVPKQTTPSNRVSKLMRTLLESGHITSQEETRLRQMILDEEVGTYEPISRQETIDAARETIANDFGGDIDRAFDSLQRAVSRNAITADTIALAEVLLAEASNAHDVERVYEVAAELRTASTALGQAVSQIAALKRASGVGQAYYIQNFIDRLNTHDYAADIANGRMKPITISPDLMRDLMMATDAEGRNGIMQKIYEQIGQQIPPTLTDTLRAWRYFAMLANPTTHIRNVIGNVMMRGLSMTKDLIATGIERSSLYTGDRSHEIVSQTERASMMPVAERLFQKHYDDIVQDGKFGIDMEINNHRNYFHTKLMNKLAKFNFNALETEDRGFLRPGFMDAFMQYVKSNGIDANKMTQAEEKSAVNYAIQQAKKNTFRNANQLATYLNRIAQMNGLSHLVVEGLVPFKKTPLNILAQGANYSPIGIVKAVYDIARNKLDSAKGVTELRKAPSEIVDEMASGLSGSLLMVLGMALSKLGILRGSGEEDEDYEKLLRENGEQAYSLNIGGYSMSLANIAPATIPLFMGVALSEYADKSGTDNALLEFVSAISSAANPMMEMTLLSSVNEALQSYSDNGLLGNIGNVAWSSAKSYVGQYLPTLPAKIYDLVDGTQRTTKSNAAARSADLDYFGRSLLKKTPLEGTLEPYIDLKGREVDHSISDNFDLWIMDAINSLLSPGTIKVKQYDATDREIARLVRSTGDTDFVPESPKKYLQIDGERVNLTAKQYTQFSKEYGQAIYSAINNLIYTQKYINASDPVRADMLSDAVSNAKKTIRNMWKDRVQFNVEEPVAVPQYEQEYELADTYIGE